MLENVTCKICGKEFEYERGIGRIRKFCSKQCSNKARNLGCANRNYWRDRYANDTAFRERKRALNSASSKRKREERRVNQRNELVRTIRAAETLEEAIELFEEKARVRADLYA